MGLVGSDSAGMLRNEEGTCLPRRSFFLLSDTLFVSVLSS